MGPDAATFVWTVVPYRMEWLYVLVSHKVIALDAGHVCQNLYLDLRAVNAAHDRAGIGREEFTVYLAPVGKGRKAER